MNDWVSQPVRLLLCGNLIKWQVLIYRLCLPPLASPLLLFNEHSLDSLAVE